MITNVCSLKSGCNLSDRAPILVELKFGTPMQSIPKVDGQGPTRHANWHKATLEQKELYRQRLDVCLAELSCSLSDVVDCCEPGCTMHCKLLDQIGIELTDCLAVGFLGRSLRTGMIQLVLQGKDLNFGIMSGEKLVIPAVVCFFN